MKNIILAYASLIAGILLADLEILNTFFTENGLHFLTQKIYTVPIFFSLVLLTIKGLYDISLYTDETIPLKIGFLSFIMAIFGLFIFFRVLILGMLFLIVAAYWSRGIVRSYYPRHLKN